MDWVNLVPPEAQEDVHFIVNTNRLTVEEKVDLLKTRVDSKLLVTIITYLTSMTIAEPNADDFLNLVPDEDNRRTMKIMIRGNNMDMLETHIRREDEDVQQAFETWKRQKGATINNSEPSTSSGQVGGSQNRQCVPTSVPLLRSSVRQYNLQTYNPPSAPPVPPEFSNLQDPVYAENPYLLPNVRERTPSLPRYSVLDPIVDEQSTLPNVQPTFFEKMPDTTTILILGETGVGKSTFINGLANYLKYGTIEAALNGGVEVLIKTFFTINDDEYNEMRIDCDPTVSVEIDGETDDNEHVGDSQSSTQSPRSYLFNFGPPGMRKSIRIIDTPGIGDCRGIEQDKLNVAKILSFISQFKELKAICVLLKPNESKLTLSFRFCLGELLSHLHKSAADNILFCCTNARSTHFKKGETIPTLRTYLKHLKDDREIDIPTTDERIYLFDNESYRYLCAMRQRAYFSHQNILEYNSSWAKTVEETFRMFETISKMPSHKTQETVSLNNVRSIVLALARPLAEITRNQLTNLKLIEEKIAELTNLKNNDKNLCSKLYVDQVTLTAQEVPYPVTVCTSHKCVEYKRLTTNSSGPMETVYKTECHCHCYLKGVQTSVCPNPALQQCVALQADIDKCQQCGCPWNTHMHVRYRLVSGMERVEDPTVLEAIKSNQDNIKVSKTFIQKQKDRKETLQKEADTISKSVAELACFVKKHSIMPYSDAFQDYIEHLIKEEKNKVSQGGSEDLLQRMEQYKLQYAQMILIVDSQSSSNVKTIDEIHVIIEKLKKLKTCGTVITEAQKFDMESQTKHQGQRATAVDLSSQWIGRLTSQQAGNYRASSTSFPSQQRVKTSAKFFERRFTRN